MGFTDIDNMMLVLHVFMFASHFLVVYHDCAVCAYHTHGKMSRRHFLVFLGFL